MIRHFKNFRYRKVATLVFSGLIFFFIGYISASAFVGPALNPPGGGGSFFVDANGNIGFGTQSGTPSTNPPDGAFGKILIVASTSNPGIGIRNLSGSGKTYVWYSRSTGQLALWDANASAVRLQVDSNGRVGIGGTNTPDELLHVFGNIKTDGSFIGALSGSIAAANVSQGVFGLNLGTFNYAFPGALAVGTNSTAGLQANSLYVNGNVGVGVINPGNTLDVAGSIRSRTGAIYSGSSANPGIIFEENDFADANYDIQVNGGALRIFEANDGRTVFNERLTLSSGGNFQVLGTATLSGNIWFGGAVTSPSLNMNGNDIVGVDKITVATIDPLYEINSKKYSTYASSIVGGTKEEFVGRGETKKGKLVIDFSEEPEGSDLWVWRKAVDFSRNTVEVLVTPYGAPALIYYEIEGEKIIFNSDKDVEFSYRLVGNRFDWRNWPTFAKDQTEKASLIIDPK